MLYYESNKSLNLVENKIIFLKSQIYVAAISHNELYIKIVMNLCACSLIDIAIDLYLHKTTHLFCYICLLNMESLLI